MYSLRSGCSISLLPSLSVSTEDIAKHNGWKSSQTANYYTQTDKGLRLTKPADLFTQSSKAASKHPIPKATLITDSFRSRNTLYSCLPALPCRRRKCAFLKAVNLLGRGLLTVFGLNKGIALLFFFYHVL